MGVKKKRQAKIGIKGEVRKLAHSDVPASIGLVMEVRDELRSEIQSVHHDLGGQMHGIRGEIQGFQGEIQSVESRLRGKIQSVEGRLGGQIQGLRGEIQSVEGRLGGQIQGLRGEIEQVRGDVQQVLVSAHRTQVLMEEQRTENKIVLDGLKNAIDWQNRMEGEVKEIRETVQSLSRARPVS